VETEMAMVTGRRLEQPRLKDGLGPQWASEDWICIAWIIPGSPWFNVV
jgi:hypothetical protein